MKEKEKPLDPEAKLMFENLFGPDAAADWINMENAKNDPMFQKQMKQASPLPLKLVDEFFKLFINAFVKVGSITVIAAIIFRSIYDSDITLTSIGDCLAVMTIFILPRIFYMLVSMGIFWVVIQTVNYLIQFGIVKIYDLQLKKSLKLHKAYVDMIKKDLKAKDEADPKLKKHGEYTEEEIIEHAKAAVKAEEAKRKVPPTYRPAPSLDEFPHN